MVRRATFERSRTSVVTNVVDFTARRLAKSAAEKNPPSISEVAVDALDFLLGDWERYARQNKLNDYFKTSLPGQIGQESTVNFMADLTQVANIEHNIGLLPMVFAPGTGSAVQRGWVVQFKLCEELVQTPDMASETYARTFAILLYLKTKRDAIDAGLNP